MQTFPDCSRSFQALAIVQSLRWALSQTPADTSTSVLLMAWGSHWWHNYKRYTELRKTLQDVNPKKSKPIRRKGVPGIPWLSLCKPKTCHLILKGHHPHTTSPPPPHSTNTHLRDPLQTDTISFRRAPQSYSEGKQMFPTDRQLNQMTCLGNRLNLFGLTERPSEFQLAAFALQNSVRKRITWMQLTCIEVIMLKVGFRVSYITGLYTQVGC